MDTAANVIQEQYTCLTTIGAMVLNWSPWVNNRSTGNVGNVHAAGGRGALFGCLRQLRRRSKRGSDSIWRSVSIVLSKQLR